MSEIYLLPEGNSGSVPAWYPALNNGGFGGNGWGGGILGFLLGLVFGNGGFGGFGGGNNAQASNFLMEALHSNGERNATAIQGLATTLGLDFNLVNQSVQTIQTALSNLTALSGLTGLQIINSILAGNTALGSLLALSCCNTQLALSTGFGNVLQSIAAMGAEDRLAICLQTNTLTNTANANSQAILAKIDAVEDSRKDREIAALTAQVAKLESLNFTAGAVQAAVSPILTQLANLSNEVAAIKRCLPPTITLPNNSMTAVPSIWANAVADNLVDRILAALTPTTTTTTQG